MSRSTFSGPVSALSAETDGGIWIPAKAGQPYTGTWTDTRVAAGDYCMRKTATAQSGQFVFHVGQALLQKIGADPNTEVAHDIRGIRIDSIDVVYQIGTSDLTSHSIALNGVTYANNTANAVAAAGGTLTGTMAVTAQTNPYVTNITLATPYVIAGNAADKTVTVEISWNAAAGTVLSYYGIYVKCSYNLL